MGLLSWYITTTQEWQDEISSDEIGIAIKRPEFQNKLKEYHNSRTISDIAKMCYSILVAKRVCQHGHLNQWTACWAQCETQMKGNLQDFIFDRLCDDIDEVRFMVIKSHAKRHIATAYPSNCEVCLRLENTPSQWASRRDALVEKMSELKNKESREKALRDELERVKSQAGSSDVIARMDEKLWIHYLDVLATRDELQRHKAKFADEKMSEMNRETVETASQLLRSHPWSTFFGVETRRFFLGHFQEDEDNFNDFKVGTFDKHLIVDYTPPGPPEPSYPTVMGIDLSPPDGIIGTLDTNEMFRIWRHYGRRVVQREP